MTNVAILLDPTDNVATALKDLKAGETVTVVLSQAPPAGAPPQSDEAGPASDVHAEPLGSVTYTVVLREDVAFGHKYASRHLPARSAQYACDCKGLGTSAPARGARPQLPQRCFGFRHDKYGVRA